MIGLLLRTVELLELWTLATCGSYLLNIHRLLLNRSLLNAGRSYVASLVVVSVGVALNATTRQAVTPGLVAVAALLAPIAGVALIATIHVSLPKPPRRS